MSAQVYLSHQYMMSSLKAQQSQRPISEDAEIPISRNNNNHQLPSRHRERERTAQSIKRNLFDVTKEDHLETKRICDREMAKIIQTKKDEYNYDFEKDEPLQGKNYKWDPIGSNVPVAYRAVNYNSASTSSYVPKVSLSPINDTRTPPKSLSSLKKSRADIAKKIPAQMSNVKRTLKFDSNEDSSNSLSEGSSKVCEYNSVESNHSTDNCTNSSSDSSIEDISVTHRRSNSKSQSITG